MTITRELAEGGKRIGDPTSAEARACLDAPMSESPVMTPPALGGARAMVPDWITAGRRRDQPMRIHLDCHRSIQCVHTAIVTSESFDKHRGYMSLRAVVIFRIDDKIDRPWLGCVELYHG